MSCLAESDSAVAIFPHKLSAHVFKDAEREGRVGNVARQRRAETPEHRANAFFLDDSGHSLNKGVDT